MRLRGEHDVAAAVEPVTDQRLDHGGRMLAVCIHEQHGAAPRKIEAREQRGFLAEITRQRDDLYVEFVGGKRIGGGERLVAAAVVDIDDLAGKIPPPPQRARHLGERTMELGQASGLIENRHHDRQAVGGGLRRGCKRAGWLSGG